MALKSFSQEFVILLLNRSGNIYLMGDNKIQVLSIIIIFMLHAKFEALSLC